MALTLTATVLSFVGITYRELLRGPVESPIPHPDVLVTPNLAGVELEFIVTNHGNANMYDIELEISGEPSAMPFARTRRLRRANANPIPPGGQHWASWSLKVPMPIAALGQAGVKLRLCAYCADDRGRKFRSAVIEFSGRDLVEKADPLS